MIVLNPILSAKARLSLTSKLTTTISIVAVNKLMGAYLKVAEFDEDLVRDSL